MKWFPYDYFSSRLYCRFFQYAVYYKQDVGKYGFGWLYTDPSKQKLPDWMFNRLREVELLHHSNNMENMKKSLRKNTREILEEVFKQ